MDCVVLGGYLEVPDVHQVQQGLQDVPCDSDCVRGEVRTLGTARMVAALCMVAPLLSLVFNASSPLGADRDMEVVDAGTRGHPACLLMCLDWCIKMACL